MSLHIFSDERSKWCEGGFTLAAFHFSRGEPPQETVGEEDAFVPLPPVMELFSAFMGELPAVSYIDIAAKQRIGPLLAESSEPPREPELLLIERPHQEEAQQSQVHQTSKRRVSRVTRKGKRHCPKTRADNLNVSSLTTSKKYSLKKSACRIFALWMICTKYLPAVRPSHIDERLWSELAVTGYTYTTFLTPPEKDKMYWKLVISIPADVDYLYRQLAIYGMHITGTKSCDNYKTHKRWWSDSPIFSPIGSKSSLCLDGSVHFARSIALPKGFIENEQFRDLTGQEKLRKVALLCTRILTTVCPDQTLLTEFIRNGLGRPKGKIVSQVPLDSSCLDSLVEKVCQTMGSVTKDSELQLFDCSSIDR